MNFELVPYETCFRVLVDGKKTAATIDFSPASKIDEELFENIEGAITMLVLSGAIKPEQKNDAAQALLGKLR